MLCDQGRLLRLNDCLLLSCYNASNSHSTTLVMWICTSLIRPDTYLIRGLAVAFKLFFVPGLSSPKLLRGDLSPAQTRSDPPAVQRKSSNDFGGFLGIADSDRPDFWYINQMLDLASLSSCSDCKYD